MLNILYFLAIFTIVNSCSVQVDHKNDQYFIKSDCKILNLRTTTDKKEVPFQRINNNEISILNIDKHNYLQTEFDNGYYYSFKLIEDQENYELDLLSLKELEVLSEFVKYHFIIDIRNAIIIAIVILFISYCVFYPIHSQIEQQ